MKVTLNGEPMELRDGSTVAALLADLGAPARGIAVAVDAQVVPKSQWETTPLVEGARVEVLTAAQGG